MENEKKQFKKEFFERTIRASIRTIRFVARLQNHQILRSVCNQLVRSTTSIGANLVEAKAASSKRAGISGGGGNILQFDLSFLFLTFDI